MSKRVGRKAAELVQAFLDRIGGKEGSAYVELFQSWREIVGDRIADHTEPVDVRGTALVVEADHPGWVQMVMMSRQSIIRQLSHRFPELTITGLHIRVGSGDAGGNAEAAGRSTEKGGRRRTSSEEPEPRTSPPAPPSRDETEALERIADEELKQSLSRLRDSLEDKE